jgi:hypothetical protein
MAAYCTFSDLPADQCAHCNNGGRPLPPDTIISANEGEPSGVGPLIPAQYPGYCAASRRHRILPGDMIRKAEDQEGWLCPRCA